jgi:TRAP-type C4-dicarboxylate transport system permease large subunit
MNFTLARIILYILAGALLNTGWVNEEIANFIRTDSDVQMLAGAGLAALTLLWWRVAKRMGWGT